MNGKSRLLLQHDWLRCASITHIVCGSVKCSVNGEQASQMIMCWSIISKVNLGCKSGLSVNQAIGTEVKVLWQILEETQVSTGMRMVKEKIIWNYHTETIRPRCYPIRPGVRGPLRAVKPSILRLSEINSSPFLGAFLTTFKGSVL